MPIRCSLPATRLPRILLRVPRVRQLSLSVVQGESYPPLDSRTLGQYFADMIQPRLTRPALVCPKEGPRPHGGPASNNPGIETHLQWNFAEFDQHIQALARGLVSLGVKKGDRVAVVMGNNSAYAMLQWACASIGAILATINPAYRVHELVNTLRLVGASHFFLVPQIRSSAYLSMLSQAIPGLLSVQPGSIQVEELPELRSIFVIDNTDGPAHFAKVLEGARYAADFREALVWREDTYEKEAVQQIGDTLHCDDVMNLQFTSGTTGLPKAVSLTHSNLLNNALSIADAMRLTQDDHRYAYPSCSRLVLGNLAVWSQGGTIVYPSEIFNPPAIVDALISQRCTALHGVPTHFLGVLTEVERRQKLGHVMDFSRLRTGIAAGTSVPIEIMKQAIDKLNLTQLTNAYGMISFQTTPDDSIECRVETVGRVRPHVCAKIVDASGDVVPVGTPGEVLVSGYLLQRGYWGDEEQTARVMKWDSDGVLWMHTGDEGILDENGYLRIVGRIKDIIIRGGENLYPVQIENVLCQHPSILEAAAVSVPDRRLGEVVGAWIVRAPGAPKLNRAEIREVVQKGMNPQNAPTWVWFVDEDGTPPELPKTASGKIQKHILRKWCRELAERDIGKV
ncbi:acyl-CoA synthetase [Vararia minispora EC-137]|uniref:Acyl-CoA synthetase n=1 Tax=Vararia minispora EC-137 TaxID=1314806 RepID=A0ACB8R027_9AGAM|nr:acyl-CoA synthetase [Vararia minispora EC-137]